MACTDVTQCGNTATEVCDPYTKMCSPGECDLQGTQCPTGQTCLGQVNMANVGACYNSCNAFGSPGCPTNQFCEPIDPGNSDGACIPVGTSGLNMACTQDSVDTGCVSGSVCVNDGTGLFCAKTCNFWSTTPGCGPGTRCVAGNLCSAQTNDPATLGTNCTTTTAGTGCAASNTTVVGLCIDPTATTGAPLQCLQWCRVSGNDCPTGKTCNAFQNLPDVGVCL